ncbi:42980_t:CDS:2 [Gigaspora margarita]|uniref:42980_t:CDS:1 n=1 Tax=Gigaspora margarita TaxID=4874 RepID=A0ABN7VM98_GIGMA|nr:42980_t:CDS:2 [Gigaspora margarita]
MHALGLDEAIKSLEALKSYPSNTDIEVSLYFTKSISTSYDQTQPEFDLNNHVPQEQTDNVPDNSVDIMNIVESIEYRPQERTNFPYYCPICQSCYLYCSYCSQNVQLNEPNNWYQG